MIHEVGERTDLSRSEPDTVQTLEETFYRWKSELPEAKNESDGIADAEGIASRTQRRALAELRGTRE